MYWADIAWKSLDLASAVGEGIVLGVYNTAAFVGNVIRHPIETTQAVVKWCCICGYYARASHRHHLKTPSAGRVWT